MPKKYILIFAVMVLGSWFLIGEKKSFLEKFFIIIVVLAIYVGYRLMSGATMEELVGQIFK